uniref:Protein-export membrane protein SecF n=1 Tax=Candidatus Kentrum sp. TUN TaxID=2126343 RepID=A0A450ZHK4_9GAMM|nr:MAG: protein translocase subunit secF [Candidatus Kentron sp. TUN]VFK53285.1 MAG: protein translocase subunit secF [Candidatus Kentron sp. TUN]VFK54097.1 MAG: protein translocase subunit secF [Candidatus Kentron sp. TUN]
MQLFSKTTSIDFMRQRRYAVAFSAILILSSLISLVVRGINFGIDFTGGTIVEIGYPKPADLGTIRTQLENTGFVGAIVQHFGTTHDVLVRLPPHENIDKATLSSQVVQDLQATAGVKLDLRRVEFVGPQVGEELTEQGGLAMLIALAAILVYVALRFEYRFALGSVAALVHDVIITLGFFSVFSLEFDLTVLAAVLAVIGYSLNDTIVVFDRIRENFRKIRKGTPIVVINKSLNQTLARTLITSVTTLLVLITLFLIGGKLIHGFSTALILGILIGTYSSIYVASTTVLMLGVSKADFMPVQKEGAELDNRP